MLRSRSTRTILCCAVALVLASPAIAGEEGRSMSIEVEGEDGARFRVSISPGLLGSLVEKLVDVDFDCDADLGGEVEEMLEHLDSRGEGARYTRTEDGTVIRAKRRRGHLELKIRSDNGEKVDIVVPWAVAECLLGNDRPLEELLRSGASEGSELRLEVEGEEGALRIRVES